MKTGIFVGSFDPFTIGHDDIVKRALPLFDRLVIGVGVNERKQCMLTAEERVARIRRLYADEPNISVEAYADLTVDLAKRVGASFIVKGVRSVKDFEYEREQAEINRQLTGIRPSCFMPMPPKRASAAVWCANWPISARMSPASCPEDRCSRYGKGGTVSRRVSLASPHCCRDCVRSGGRPGR